MDRARAEHWVLLGTFIGFRHCCIKEHIINGKQAMKPCSKCQPIGRAPKPKYYFQGMPLDLSARQMAKARAILRRTNWL